MEAEMSDDCDSREQGAVSPRSKALNAKVHPIAIVGVSVFIIGFLALVITVQQFPENWFEEKYLRGSGALVAAFVLFCTVMAGVALVEWLIKRGKANGQGSR
jgi:hypothetical protein